MSTKIKLLIAIGLLLALTGGAYLYGVTYFGEHYLPGSTVNGYNCSYMSVDEAELLMNREAEAFVLAVETLGGGREAITAKEVGLYYSSDGTIESQIKGQDRYLWFTQFNERHAYDLSRSLSYDRTKMAAAVGDLKCMDPAVVDPPQNAAIYQKDDGTFAIREEVNGSMVDEAKAFDCIARAMVTGQVTVNLEAEGCYLRPSVTKDDPVLNTNIEAMNRMCSAIITYDFGSSTQRVGRDQISTWFGEDQGGYIFLDRERVKAYVQALKDTYDTVGGERRFTTYLGQPIQISGGDFGWVIDLEAETDTLYSYIIEGQTLVREPIYAISGYTRQGDYDIGYTYVEICKANQRLVYYDTGRPLLQVDCVTGDGTPTGVFRAGVRQLPFHLTSGFRYSVPIMETFGSDPSTMIDYSNVELYNGDIMSADVQVWLPFGNVGISEGVARTSYGIEGYNAAPTMGNVEVPLDAAYSLAQVFTEGLPVVVY